MQRNPVPGYNGVMNNPTVPTLNLSAREIARLIDIVNDKSDALFEKLNAHDARAFSPALSPGDRQAAQNRAEGLREALRFWDGIERQLKVTHGAAQRSEEAAR